MQLTQARTDLILLGAASSPCSQVSKKDSVIQSILFLQGWMHLFAILSALCAVDIMIVLAVENNCCHAAAQSGLQVLGPRPIATSGGTGSPKTHQGFNTGKDRVSASVSVHACHMTRLAS